MTVPGSSYVSELEQFLLRFMRDVGRHAFGVVAAEVYVLQDNCLTRPAGGWWSSSTFVPSFNGKSALEKLALSPTPAAPGKGLVGMLYQETVAGGHLKWCNLQTLINDPDRQSDERSLWASLAFGSAACVRIKVH